MSPITDGDQPRRVGLVKILQCFVLAVPGFGITFLLTLVIDLLIRFWVLPRTRKNKTKRIATINRLVKTWGRGCFWAGRTFMRLKVNIHGNIPTEGRYLVISNHQSSFDIPVLVALFPHLNLKFVAKESLRYGAPLVSIVSREGGGVFIDQIHPGKDLANLTQFAKTLAEYDGSPCLFPEGARTKDGELLPFRIAGIEAVRRKARLPILLVTIDGLWQGRTLADYHLNFKGPLTLTVSEPIPWESLESDPREAYSKIEASMAETLRKHRSQDS